MLSKLIIENYALIEKLDLNFSTGFSIITGETGAGKSIMLDALGLLLGERAESKAIADKTRKTVVEAYFSDIPEFLQPIFLNHSLDWDSSLIVRREISPSGRSRAFVNDTPVTLQVLSEITLKLIDIHSQHSNIELQKESNQIEMIDQYSDNQELLKKYQSLFNEYVELRHKIRKEKNNIEKQKEKREYIAFRLEQLDKIKPKLGELEKIEKEFDILSDAEQIRTDLNEACILLDEGEGSILSSLATLESLISSNELSLLGEEGEDNIPERVRNIKIELKDITEILYSYSEHVELNPARLAKLSARMNILYDAIKRFKVKDEKELVELYEDLQKSLETINTGDDLLTGMEKEAKTLVRKIKNLADELSEIRKAGADDFSKKILEKARTLGLPNLNIKIEILKGKLSYEGQDKIEFLCSFNKNHPLKPISSVASGGEISRLMLAIKSIISEHQTLPTLIFDEIDTGVSGEIADKMGSMMQKMGHKIQVIAITHLPQVASRGKSHYKVYKKDEEEKTVSHIRLLTHDERVEEIASMLSGETLNKAALENAKVLLEQREKD